MLDALFKGLRTGYKDIGALYIKAFIIRENSQPYYRAIAYDDECKIVKEIIWKGQI
jgi:hypothetical protein